MSSREDVSNPGVVTSGAMIDSVPGQTTSPYVVLESHWRRAMTAKRRRPPQVGTVGGLLAHGLRLTIYCDVRECHHS
jgi:hypothetical protein